MKRLFWLLALCACEPEVQPAAGPSCAAALKVSPTGQVNVKGVGKLCATAEDCRGLQAAQCPRQFEPKGVDFCTLPCFNDSGCGDSATCRKTADGLQHCVPHACADSVGEILLNPGKPKDCFVGQVNPLGLGKVCQTQADCQGTKMPICPRQFHPLAPNFCNKFCKQDAECGDQGICRLVYSVEGGTVQYCLPATCWETLHGGEELPPQPDAAP